MVYFEYRETGVFLNMFDLSSLYHPLTATPLGRSSYAEIPPCDALRSHIRCFWYSYPSARPAALVIPDTCMDLLFIQHGSSILCHFCPLDDRPFLSARQSSIVFAVRFYPWSAALFADEPLTGTLNLGFDARQHFPALAEKLLRMVVQTSTFEQRCRMAERLLLEHIERRSLPPDFLNAIHGILQSEGRIRTADLAQSVQLSPRQLERLFGRLSGAPPKKLTSLIRYQRLWREAVYSPHFDIQDAVYRYGYADQSHLLRQFKQYHSFTLNGALAYARQHVAFLQDSAR